jgi:hypothetical protein
MILMNFELDGFIISIDSFVSFNNYMGDKLIKRIIENNKWLKDYENDEDKLFIEIDTTLKIGRKIQDIKIKNIVENEDINNTVEEMKNITKNLQDTSQRLNDTFSNSKKSSVKGRVSENIVEVELRKYFKDDVIEDVSKQTGKGDLLFTDNKQKIQIMIDVKNYETAVKTIEIDKLKRDQIGDQKIYAILASFGPIAKKKGLDIEEHTNPNNNDNNTYTILYVPNLKDGFTALFWAIIYYKRIKKNELSNNIEKEDIKVIKEKLDNANKIIKDELDRLDNVIKKYNKNKNDVIKILDNYDYEIESIKKNIENYINFFK